MSKKGGEIIPKITGVDLAARPADSRPFQYITRCPECGTPLVKYEGESKHYCPNQSHCRPQILGRIIHFIRRKAMDIEDWAKRPSNCSSKTDCCTTSPTCTTCGPNSSPVCPGWAKKSAENIIRSIRGSVEVPFQRVLFALGIRFVGETTAKYLAAHFRTLDAVMHATREELIEADEVGGKIADAIIDYFADAENLRIIERLRKAGLQTEAAHKALESESLAGKNFVITGRFSGHSRDELKELIEAHGGKNLAAVSANVDFLVAGEKIGPAKLQKATKLGVRLISEEELLAMIASGGTLPVTENASGREHVCGTPVGSGNDRQNRRRQHGTGVAVLGGKRHSRAEKTHNIISGACPDTENNDVKNQNNTNELLSRSYARQAPAGQFPTPSEKEIQRKRDANTQTAATNGRERIRKTGRSLGSVQGYNYQI